MKKILSIVNILEEREVRRNMKRDILKFNKTPAGITMHIVVLAIMITVPAFNPAYAQIQGLSGLSGGQSGSLTGPASGGPMGSFTSPVSSRTRSLIPSTRYNPSYGNMLVTGNVGGGKEFRGVVPYTAPRDFRAALPSSSTDDFLRYSTPAGEPFYSRTRSPLGTTDVGTLAITRQPSEKIRSSEGSNTFIVSPFQTITPQAASSALVPLGGYSYRNTLLDRVEGYRNERKLMPLGESAEQILTSDKIIVPQQPPEFTADKTKIDIDILKPFEIPKPTAKAVETTRTSEQTNAELETIRKILKDQEDREEANKLIEKAVSDNWQARLKETEMPTGKKPSQDRTARRETSSGQKGGSAPAAVLKTEEMPERPKKIVKEASLFDQQFEEKMQTARKLMEEGKFYQAVDAYTYATLYKPLEPSGFVGKALAYFAAGEYLSSSQMLAAGLAVSPDYAKVKQDISKLLADQNKFQARMKDLDKSVAESLKPEILYLTAYICLQTDQMAKAQQAIDLAVQSAPNDKTISSLKKIIDETRSSR